MNCRFALVSQNDNRSCVRKGAEKLFIDISVAIVSTKIPVLLDHGFWGFSLTKLPRYGFLSAIHKARTDLAMWFGLVFLLVVGAGKTYSLDAALTAAVTTSDVVRNSHPTSAFTRRENCKIRHVFPTSHAADWPPDFRLRRRRSIPELPDSAAEKRMIVHQSSGSICRNQS